ncbi:MAG: hypothetical protein P4L87_03615 [Formivibrio sp.]|nr:hypothetical protein [Formivibrio sp.]
MDEIFPLASSRHKTWLADAQAMNTVLSLATNIAGDRSFGAPTAWQQNNALAQNSNLSFTENAKVTSEQ